MKNFKRISVVFLTLMLSVVTLISCGGPKTTPEESAKIILDVVIKDDKSSIDKVGITEKEYTGIRDAFENGLMKGISSAGVDENILTNEVKDKFKSDILAGLKKVKYEVKKISEDKDTAKVEVKLSGFDMEKIGKTAEDELKKKFEANPTMTEKDIYQESFKIVGGKIADGVLVENPKTMTLTFTKENNVWMPKESELVDLMSAIVN